MRLTFIVFMVIEIAHYCESLKFSLQYFMECKNIKETLPKVQINKKGNIDDSVLRTIIRKNLEAPSQCFGHKNM